MSCRIKIVYDTKYTEHRTGPGFPECPERVEAIASHLRQLGLLTEENLLDPREASLEELALCHTEAYIQKVEEEAALCREGAIRQLSTGDVLICRDSFRVARLAVGGVLRAVDEVVEGSCKRVFCAVRPPGHHAESSRGMGFCLFNQAAIAARYAQRTFGLKRIAIIDWDVHHGNGTEEIFASDSSVLYFSTHQSPFYPFTGPSKASPEEALYNYPLPAGSREEMLRIYREELPKALALFRPDCLLISAGFDAHRQDPIGGFRLEDEDFKALAFIVKQEAERYAEGRIVSILEGGYHLGALARSAAAHLLGLQADSS